jgi:hypothetical protein
VTRKKGEKTKRRENEKEIVGTKQRKVEQEKRPRETRVRI